MNRTVSFQTKIAVCAISFVLFLLLIFYWRSFKSEANDFADIINKGNAFMEASCYKEAIDCYQKALEKEPGNERVVLAVINAYMLLGESQNGSDEAIVSYLTALAIRPNNRTAYWAIADIYEGRGDEEAMLDILQKGFADTGDSTMEKKIARIRNEKSIAQNNSAYQQMDEKERKLREERAANMLGPLLEYFQNEDYDSLKQLLSEQNYIDFSDEIIGNNIYYLGEKDSYGNYDGIGLGAYENSYYYYGNYENNKRSGYGVWFRASYSKNSSVDSYLFEGQWSDDAPNGEGVATTHYKDDMVSSNDFITEVVEGNFSNGLENGRMTFTGTTKGKATQVFEYRIFDGIPDKIEDGEDGGFVFAKTKSGNASLTSDGSIRGVSGFDVDNYDDNSYSSSLFDTVEGGTSTVFRRDDEYEDYYDEDSDDQEEYEIEEDVDIDDDDGNMDSGTSVNNSELFRDNNASLTNEDTTFSYDNGENTTKEIFGE